MVNRPNLATRSLRHRRHGRQSDHGQKTPYSGQGPGAVERSAPQRGQDEETQP